MKTKLEDYNTDKQYKYYYNLIKKYISVCNNTDIKINQYVPNSHIAETFQYLLHYIVLENMYQELFHNPRIYVGEVFEDGETKKVESLDETTYFLLERLHEYFDSELLKINDTDEIHRVYQKLREKDDFLRNVQKLINIHLSKQIMKHFSDNDLVSHRIKTKNKYNI